MFTRSFITLLTIALGIAATPIRIQDSAVTLQVAKRVQVLRAGSLLEQDQARAKALRDVALGKRDATVPVTNTLVSYTADVGVGSPAVNYTLIVDTGSSNTWIGAAKAYNNATSTSKDTGDTVSVEYGSGKFNGEEYIDTVVLSSSLTIPQQSIGVASSATGFDGVDGILGVGPVDLTQKTLSSQKLVPTVTDNLFSQGQIKENLLGVSFQPTLNESGSVNGELTFGEINPAHYTGEITYAPITTTSPASKYWGIDQTITYGNSTVIQKATAGIVDTGTTLTLLATDAFGVYTNVTGAVQDDTVGLLKITNDQFANLQSLFFEVQGTKFELTPNAQIWPRSLNTAIGGVQDAIYLIVADLGDIGGQGLDFINGMSFLERFYSVYDTANNRVGLANTPWSNIEQN